MIPFKIYSNLTARLGNGPVVYIDPMGLRNEHLDADAVLITQPRADAFSPEDIKKVSNSSTIIVAPKSMDGELAKVGADNVRLMSPGENARLAIGDKHIDIEALPTSQEASALGYVVTINKERFFYAGAVGRIPIHDNISADYGFFGLGSGQMSYQDALDLSIAMKLRMAVPIRFENITDAYRFNLDYVNGRLCELKETFRQMGLPDEVFEETITDIDAKSEECRMLYGVNGLADLYNWYEKFLRGRIRRYGRLEFELLSRAEANTRFPAALEIMDGEDWIANVHIPSNGGGLNKENIEEAFAKAYEAFAVNEHCFSDGVLRLVCRSWLLDDIMCDILKESSGILALRREFDVIGYRDNPAFHERAYIWANDSKRPLEELPESNSLQRGMKKFLMSGGMPKEGLGVRKYTRLERK